MWGATTTHSNASRARAAYDQWHQLIPADEARDAPWHHLLKTRLNVQAHLAGRAVLEIGCGRGSLARWIMTQHPRPARLVAADFSPAALWKAREAAEQAGLPPIDWEACDIQALSFRPSTFDTVISCETIEHVLDPPGAVRELARVLKPGGRLLLTTPNYLGPLGVYRAYLRLTGRRYTETGQPVNRFTLLPLTLAWIRRAGLQVEFVDGTGHYVPVPGRPPIEVPALGRPHVLMRWFGLHSLVVARKPNGRPSLRS